MSRKDKAPDQRIRYDNRRAERPWNARNWDSGRPADRKKDPAAGRRWGSSADDGIAAECADPPSCSSRCSTRSLPFQCRTLNAVQLHRFNRGSDARSLGLTYPNGRRGREPDRDRGIGPTASSCEWFRAPESRRRWPEANAPFERWAALVRDDPTREPTKYLSKIIRFIHSFSRFLCYV